MGKRFTSPAQFKRSPGSMEARDTKVLSSLLHKLQVKRFSRGQQQYPKAEEWDQESFKELSGSKSQEVQKPTPTSNRRGRGLYEVVPEVGVRGKLHLGLGNLTRMHQKHSGNTEHAPLRSEHHSPAVELQEQRFRRWASLQGSITLEKEGCSHSCESQYWKRACRWPAHGFEIGGKGRLPHRKHREWSGKLGSMEWHTLHLCPLHKIWAVVFLINSISLESKHATSCKGLQ